MKDLSLTLGKVFEETTIGTTYRVLNRGLMHPNLNLEEARVAAESMFCFKIVSFSGSGQNVEIASVKRVEPNPELCRSCEVSTFCQQKLG